MTNISRLLALVTIAGVVLVRAAGAAGHRFTSMFGYVSMVSGVDPLVPGVTARVLQGVAPHPGGESGSTRHPPGA